MADRESGTDAGRRRRKRSALSTVSSPVGAPGLRDGTLPERLGQYRILRKLGTGGMGEVLLAFDETLSRAIALKRIRPDRKERRRTQRRFDVEARVTALLQHPSIIPIYHYVRGEAEAFYTMRPIEGMTLGQVIETLRTDFDAQRDEWTTARLLRLFLQACNAVAYAHSRGVIHRDLKPDNIMIGPFEEVLVLDWGMAVIVGEGLEGEPHDSRPRGTSDLVVETESDAFVGTPAYMAPEQLRQHPATHRSEVFALGVTLYELLTFRRPWKAGTVAEMLAEMTRPPVAPTTLQPGHSLPARMDAIVLRALANDPSERYPSVGSFAREVALALEGRAPWELSETSLTRDRWHMADGKILAANDELMLLSRRHPFRYFLDQRLDDNVRLEFRIRVDRGNHQFAVWLNTTMAAGHVIRDGYSLEVASGRRQTVSLLRSGRDVAGATSPTFAPGRWHRVAALREDDRLSLWVDGTEMYSYHDPIPLTGGFVGLSGVSNGLRVQDLRVYSRGAHATVSCLSIPDAFFNRGYYQDARAEYDGIVTSHRGRTEARLARFRSALCIIEEHRREDDPDVRTLLLEEARDALAAGGERPESCLAFLGTAMVADEAGATADMRDAIRSCFRDFPDDHDLPATREWILGRLHSAGPDDRRVVADLLPLAIEHCVGGWGRRLVRETAHRVRRDWETPSFLIGRSRFRQRDPTTTAECRLFCAFWSADVDLLRDTATRLIAERRLRPYHVSDLFFAALELGHPNVAGELLSEVEEALGTDGDAGRFLAACRAVVAGLGGDLESAESRLKALEPQPEDRTFNSARLWVARSCSERGDPRRLHRVLQPIGPRDFFAREHRSWFHLRRGDLPRARRELEPLIRRNDHVRGRNLVNFLYGALLQARGEVVRSRQVFERLEPRRWPRSWTLGSHYALGRLGNGSTEAYERGAFPWERTNLARHRDLLREEGALRR